MKNPVVQFIVLSMAACGIAFVILYISGQDMEIEKLKAKKDRSVQVEPIIGGKSVTMLFCNMPRDSTGRSLGFIWHAHSLPDSVWYLWGVVSPQGLLELQEMAGHGLDLDTMPPTVLVNTKGFLPFGRKEIE